KFDIGRVGHLDIANQIAHMVPNFYLPASRILLRCLQRCELLFSDVIELVDKFRAILLQNVDTSAGTLLTINAHDGSRLEAFVYKRLSYVVILFRVIESWTGNTRFWHLHEMLIALLEV